MTNLEALKADFTYPISSQQCEKALTDQGLTGTAFYTTTNSSYALARAAICILIATSAAITEGGFSVSVSERENLKTIAQKIVAKYGDPKGTIILPSASVTDKSGKW